MTDQRTPEQRAASQALRDAIEVVCRLQGFDSEIVPGDDGTQDIVAEFVAVVRLVGFRSNELHVSRYSMVVNGDGVEPDSPPFHSVEGLLRYGLRTLEHE